MRAFGVAGWVSAAVLQGAACAPPPADQCRAAISATCTMAWKCYAPATLDTSIMKELYGTSLEDCRARREASAQCAGLSSDSQLCTGASAGLIFQPANASACNEKTLALSCDDFKNFANRAPAECAKVCQ